MVASIDDRRYSRCRSIDVHRWRSEDDERGSAGRGDRCGAERAWPRRRTCWIAGWSRWCWRPGRRRGRRCASGITCGCSPGGASWSTRPRRSCWRRRAGQRRTRTGYPTGAEWAERVPAAAGRRAGRPGALRRTGGRAWPGGAGTVVVDAGRDTRAADRARRDRRPGRSGSPRGRWSTRRAPGRGRTRWAPTGCRRSAKPAAADRITYRVPDLTDPAVAGSVRGQARRGRRLRALGADRAGRVRRPRRAAPGHPGRLAAAARLRSATPSAAATPTSCPPAARSGSGPPRRSTAGHIRTVTGFRTAAVARADRRAASCWSRSTGAGWTRSTRSWW